jgi:Protein of unknown function (DUF1569)
MPLPNIFDNEVSQQLISRIKKLTSGTQPKWGKMTVSQMLAHCNVSYEYVYEPEKYKPAPAFMKFILKLFVKNTVVSEKPYKHDSQTAPDFKITNDKNFQEEQARLINFIEKTFALGSSFFEGRESHSFGKLTATEWSNMFYKHLDHHLTQFGV